MTVLNMLEKVKVGRCEDQWLPEVRSKRGMNKWSTEDFWRRENILLDIIMVDKCHYAVVQTNGTIPPRGNSNSKL